MIEDAVWSLENGEMRCHVHHPKLEFQQQLQASRGERDEKRRTRKFRRRAEKRLQKERAIIQGFSGLKSGPPAPPVVRRKMPRPPFVQDLTTRRRPKSQ